MLKDLRKALNLSIGDLESLIDTDERTIRRWEDGKTPTPFSVILLLKIMEAGDQEIADFVWFEADKHHNGRKK